MINEAVYKFWVEFCEESATDVKTPFQVWYFGLGSEDAKELCDLVLQGKKSATA